MLNLYRRHVMKCPHRGKGQNYTKCSCPIWCDGDRNGKRARLSMKTRDGAGQYKRLEKWEENPIASTPAVRTVSAAVKAFVDDCRARKLGTSTIKSYSTSLARMQEFLEGRGIRDLDGLNVELFGQFRAQRSLAPSSAVRELQMLRTFCSFAVEREWIPRKLRQKSEGTQ